MDDAELKTSNVLRALFLFRVGGKSLSAYPVERADTSDNFLYSPTLLTMFIV